MRKFSFVHDKNQYFIYEIEVTAVTPTPWECKAGEQLYIVSAPEQFKSERWYSQFTYDTLEQAKLNVKKLIDVEIENAFRKKNITFFEEELTERYKIKVEML